MAKKNVYFFGDGKADGNSSVEMVNLLGGKGANLAEMVNYDIRFRLDSLSQRKFARPIMRTKAKCRMNS